MSEKGFKIWVSQSVQDLKKHRRDLEEQKKTLAAPLDARISEIDTILFAMQGSPKIETPQRSPRAKRTGVKKGYTYNGTHWTQRPENAAKVRSIALNAARSKRT